VELKTALKRDFLFTAKVDGDNVFMLLNKGIGPNKEGESYIDGALFAQEAYYWKSQGKKIIVKINCLGGRVIHGWDMIDAIIECQADTFGAGVAFSMAGMCLIAGKNRKAYNHASAMIHSPRPAAGTAKTSSPILDVMVSQFKTLLETRTKFTAAEITGLLNGEDHFFTAEQMQKKGMIDEVISSGINAPINASLEAQYEFYNNSIEDFKTQTDNDMDFKAILAQLTGKSGEAESIVAVTEMKAQLEQFKASQASDKLKFEAEKKVLEDKVKELENAGKANEVKAKATELIENAVKAGKMSFTADADKVKAIENASKNFDATKEFIDGLKATKTVAAVSTVKEDKNENNSYEWLAKNAPEKLKAIAESDPDLFNKLSDEYNEQIKKDLTK
jgi:ATP-dependent protease ClpP protease subunit